MIGYNNIRHFDLGTRLKKWAGGVIRTITICALLMVGC